jgi:hypothetical protein
MLSRPSRDESRCLDMLAAKACSPGSDSIQFLRGTHAFAAGWVPATNLFSEGRESMAALGISKGTRSETLPPLSVSASKAGGNGSFFLGRRTKHGSTCLLLVP